MELHGYTWSTPSVRTVRPLICRSRNSTCVAAGSIVVSLRRDAELLRRDMAAKAQCPMDLQWLLTYHWLVVGPPLWTIWKSIGMIIPNIWDNKKCSKPPTRSLFIGFVWKSHWIAFSFNMKSVWSQVALECLSLAAYSNEKERYAQILCRGAPLAPRSLQIHREVCWFHIELRKMGCFFCFFHRTLQESLWNTCLQFPFQTDIDTHHYLCMAVTHTSKHSSCLTIVWNVCC